MRKAKILFVVALMAIVIAIFPITTLAIGPPSPVRPAPLAAGPPLGMPSVIGGNKNTTVVTPDIPAPPRTGSQVPYGAPRVPGEAIPMGSLPQTMDSTNWFPFALLLTSGTVLAVSGMVYKREYAM